MPIEEFSLEEAQQLDGIVRLQSGEGCNVELSSPAYGETPTIAVIEAGEGGVKDNAGQKPDTYQIIDMRNAAIGEDGSKLLLGYSFDPSVSFLVVAQDVDFDKGIGYKGLRVSEGTVQFGRYDANTMQEDDIRARFTANEYTSRSHFAVTATEEGIQIKDTNSKNGTVVRTVPDALMDVKNIEPEVSQEMSASEMLNSIREHFQTDLENDLTRRGVEKLLRRVNEILPRFDEPQLKDAFDIIVNESLDGVPITKLFGKYNVSEKYEKRLRILSIYESNPEMARAIVTHEVIGFHGSRSGSLWGVVKHDGLLSAAESRRKGQTLSTGERTYSGQEGQPTISFADYSKNQSLAMYAGVDSHPFNAKDLENDYQALLRATEEAKKSWGDEHPYTINSRLIANDILQQIRQLEENPDSFESWLLKANFPVAYGLSVKNLDTVEMYHQKEKGKIVERVPSDIEGEFLLIDDRAGLEHIPVVAVPKEHIQIVQQFFDINNKQVYVADIELLLR